jgi:uncharacterized membrane protein
MRPLSPTRLQLMSLAVATAAGLGARLFDLTAGTLQLDEGYTVVLAGNTVTDIFALAQTDANPPLTSLFYKAWTGIFGRGELAWELPAALLGTLAIPLVALLGVVMTGSWTVGVLVAWLLAASPLHVHFSQQVRSYALAIDLLIIAGAALALDVARARARWAATFVAAAWLSFATHYYALLALAGLLAGALLAARGKRKPTLRVLGLTSAFALLSIPTFAWLFFQYTTYYSFDWIGRPDARTLWSSWATLSGEWWPLVAVMSLLAAAGAALLLTRERGGLARSGVLLLLGWMLIPTVLAYATSLLGRPFLSSRYVVLWLPPLLVLAARGIAALPRRWQQGAVLGLIVLLTVPLHWNKHAERVRTEVEERSYRLMEERFRDGDVILHLSKKSYIPALAYRDHRLPEFFLAGTPSSNVMTYWMDEQTQLSLDELHGYKRVWLYRRPGPSRNTLEKVVARMRELGLSPILLKRHDREAEIRLYRLRAK